MTGSSGARGTGEGVREQSKAVCAWTQAQDRPDGQDARSETPAGIAVPTSTSCRSHAAFLAAAVGLCWGGVREGMTKEVERELSERARERKRERGGKRGRGRGSEKEGGKERQRVPEKERERQVRTDTDRQGERRRGEMGQPR
eukprot:215063-Rhodomonas_salina.2